MKKESFTAEQSQAERYNRKVKNKEKLDFEDFKFMIQLRMEFPFFYKGKMYEIVWGKEGLEFYRNQTRTYSSQEYEIYPSGEDFIEKVRIDGKKLYEIVTHLEF